MASHVEKPALNIHKELSILRGADKVMKGGSIDGTVIGRDIQAAISATTISANNKIYAIGTGSNITADTDVAIVDGYGLKGNRDTFYLTNSGNVQIGVGGTHNANPAMSFTTSQNISHKLLFVVSDRVFTEAFHPNADAWTTPRRITLGGDATGFVEFDGSSNVTLAASVQDDSHDHSQVFIPDTRGSQREPNYYPGRNASWDFQNNADTRTGSSDTWNVLNTISKWVSHNNSHTVEQVAYTGSNMMHRVSTSSTTWSGWNTIAYLTDNVASATTLSAGADRTKLDDFTTTRALTLSGDISGSVNIDGSSDYTLNASVVDDSHNHTSLTGITELSFQTEGSDSASISTTTQSNNTYFDFNLSDDIGQDDIWRWRFNPSGGSTFSAMELDVTSLTSADLRVSGNLSAATKSFLIPHPLYKDKTLRHGSLEGPENGVYVRGRLTNYNKIILPDYWSKLIDENTITVELTSIGKHQSLFVKDINISEICIGQKIVDKLMGNIIDCFYIIYAERIDVEKLKVVE